MTVVIAKNEEEWHLLRKGCVTASEIAILLGLNPYSSPNKLKAEKLNSTFSGNSFTRVGQVLEPVVVEIVNEVLGESFKLYETSKGKPFYRRGSLGATPDATNEKALLECKTTRPYTYERYREDAPLSYLIQLQSQLYCTETEIGYLAILSTNLTQETERLIWPITVYKIQYSDTLSMLMEEEAKRFIEEPSYRVNSRNKKKAQMLLSMNTTKIYLGE